jgi:small subunit ribosomal protein S4
MKEASASRGQSGAAVLEFLERRLDNAVYRAGFAPSRRGARQLVTHGHFMLNGRRVDIPSIRLTVDDSIEIRDHSKKSDYFKRLEDTSPAPAQIPSWLRVNRKKVSFVVAGLPTRDDAEPDIKEQLIVEYYSR